MSSTIGLRFRGEATALSADDRRALMRRESALGDGITARVTAIVADVRRRGDTALRELARTLDDVTLDGLEVPPATVSRALAAIAPDVRRAMERAARNIRTVHGAFAPLAMEVEPEPGVRVTRRPDPLARVGVYAPGGRASYPSSVLMAAVPARVAGVREIVLCSPPDATGAPPTAVLAAAALAGVDRVFALGGAGAVAAMAFGTETVPRVDRIVGPGNAYVAAAKLQVVGDVAIDSPAGPSELLVIADDSAGADTVAAEMVAQAEHDPLACVVVLVIGDAMARAVERALAFAVRDTPRRAIVEQALASQGGVLRVNDGAHAVRLASEYAPEHLLLVVREPETLLPDIRGAGTVFVGETSSVVFGDYMTGANHVLPTGGLARAYSGLSPLDFVRWTTIQSVGRAAAGRLSADVERFALAESLPGHALAARRWSVAS